jgi:hypothetical protein
MKIIVALAGRPRFSLGQIVSEATLPLLPAMRIPINLHAAIYETLHVYK